MLGQERDEAFLETDGIEAALFRRAAAGLLKLGRLGGFRLLRRFGLAAASHEIDELPDEVGVALLGHR